jgi:DNA-binding beta-propeller fold protein YncE
MGQKGSGPDQFQSPGGVAIDRQGNVYVADTGNRRILKLAAR